MPLDVKNVTIRTVTKNSVTIGHVGAFSSMSRSLARRIGGHVRHPLFLRANSTIT